MCCHQLSLSLSHRPCPCSSRTPPTPPPQLTHPSPTRCHSMGRPLPKQITNSHANDAPRARANSGRGGGCRVGRAARNLGQPASTLAGVCGLSADLWVRPTLQPLQHTSGGVQSASAHALPGRGAASAARCRRRLHHGTGDRQIAHWYRAHCSPSQAPQPAETARFGVKAGWEPRPPSTVLTAACLDELQIAAGATWGSEPACTP